MKDEFYGRGCFEILFGYLHIIYGHIMNNLPKTDLKTHMRNDLFSHALKYISDGYTERIPLKEVSRYCGVDQAHLSRIFSQKIPGGFSGYLQQLRTEHAKNLLQNTDDNVYEILLGFGFTSQRTFNRVFKNNTGMTPKAYKMLKNRKVNY